MPEGDSPPPRNGPGTVGYVDARLEDHMRVHESEQRALLAAREAVAARLEGMNQFREQMTQQSHTFVTRDVLDAVVKERNIRIDHLQDKLDLLAGQAQRAAIAAGIMSGFVGLVAGAVLIRLLT